MVVVADNGEPGSRVRLLNELEPTDMSACDPTLGLACRT